MKKLLSAGIRLIKGGAASSKKSYGNIPKGKPISKSGVESALSKAGVPRSLGKVKSKAKAFKGVQSAGATKVAKTTAKRTPKVNPYGAAAAVGAAGGIALQSKAQKAKSAKAAAQPSAVALKKKAAPKKTASVKIAPYKAKSVVAKSKPRVASSTPTAKKTPTSFSDEKEKVGYIKSNRSGRGGLRTRGR